jgi:hypothetical protein
MPLNENMSRLMQLENIRKAVQGANSIEELKSAILDLVTIMADEAQEELETED